MPASAQQAQYLPDEAATLAFGRRLACRLIAPDGYNRDAIVFLQGVVGAGKTTLVRGILRGLGFMGPVKSPTFTLLEPYEELLVDHFDLYRIADCQELDFIGIEELLARPSIKLIEWPERGAGRLPAPDLIVDLRVQGLGRTVALRT